MMAAAAPTVATALLMHAPPVHAGQEPRAGVRGIFKRIAGGRSVP
jgi:hypothetical protein